MPQGNTEIAASVIEDALEFALAAHKGQVDKGGHPYILHPLRLMLSMETDHERLAALLHDVVEDNDGVSFEDLETLGIPDRVVDALRMLTHGDDEPYMDYIARIARHALARKVKMADLRDNMNVRRMRNFSDRDAERVRKYISAYSLLEQAPD